MQPLFLRFYEKRRRVNFFTRRLIALAPAAGVDVAAGHRFWIDLIYAFAAPSSIGFAKQGARPHTLAICASTSFHAATHLEQPNMLSPACPAARQLAQISSPAAPQWAHRSALFRLVGIAMTTSALKLPLYKSALLD